MAQASLRPPHHSKGWSHNLMKAETSTQPQPHTRPHNNKYVLSDCLRVTQKAIVQLNASSTSLFPSADTEQSADILDPTINDESYDHETDNHAGTTTKRCTADFKSRRPLLLKGRLKASKKRILRVRIPKTVNSSVISDTTPSPSGQRTKIGSVEKDTYNTVAGIGKLIRERASLPLASGIENDKCLPGSDRSSAQQSADDKLYGHQQHSQDESEEINGLMPAFRNAEKRGNPETHGEELQIKEETKRDGRVGLKPDSQTKTEMNGETELQPCVSRGTERTRTPAFKLRTPTFTSRSPTPIRHTRSPQDRKAFVIQPKNDHDVGHGAPSRKDSFTIRGSSIQRFKGEARSDQGNLLQKRHYYKERRTFPSSGNKFLHFEKPESSTTNNGKSASGKTDVFHTTKDRTARGRITAALKSTRPSGSHAGKSENCGDSSLSIGKAGFAVRPKVHEKAGLEEPRSKTSTGHYPLKVITVFRRCTKSARNFRRLESSSSSSSQSSAFNNNPSHQSRRIDRSITVPECRMVSRRLEEVLYNDNMTKFREQLSSFEISDRKKIVDFKETPGTANLFFRTCILGKITLVELMVKECQPNLELTGPFIVQDGDSQHMVTPLWYASATGNLQLLRLLKEAGGNLDTCSNTGSSAILAACYMTHVDVVKFLMASKANAHKANAKGLTCLMSSVHSIPLVRLLLLNGADTNTIDNTGNTALHYATQNGHLTTVKMLLELGGNPFLSNNESYNVFQMAAKHRQKEIMDFLLQNSVSLRIEDIINVYELFASMAILLDQDFDLGYTYFFKAATLRYMNKSTDISKRQKYPSELGRFENVKEFNTISELQFCVGDHEKLTFQALLVCERQRGWIHDSYTQLLLFCGANFADSMDFRRASRLWKLSYDLCYRKFVTHLSSTPEPFNQHLMKNVHSIVKLLYQWRRDDSFGFEFNFNDDGPGIEYHRVPETSIREILILLCEHAIFAHPYFLSDTKEICEMYRSQYYVLLRSVLCILLVYIDSFSLTQESQEMESVLQRVQNLVFSFLEVKSTTVMTLLHMSILPDTLEFLDIDFDPNLSMNWPSEAIIDILLRLGSDVTMSDADGNTPLHMAAALCGHPRLSHESVERIVQKLLAKGSHPDRVNMAGQTPLDLIPLGKIKSLISSYISLKCLAARVISKYNISYIDEVPSVLYSFIELHSNINQCS